MSRMRDFRIFKKLVDQLQKRKIENQFEKIATVFAGTEEYPGEKVFKSESGEYMTKETWIDNVKTIEGYLTNFAADFLKNDEYNAFKHGLAVFPGDRMIRLAEGDGGKEILSREGDSILSLCIAKEGYLAKKVSFYDFDLKAALIVKIDRLIDLIINLAKIRYLDAESATLGFGGTKYFEILDQAYQDNNVIVKSFSENLWPPLKR